jgi:hypothetical protein
MSRQATPSAEFPNDNPAMHGGARWVCDAVCGTPVALAPSREDSPSSAFVVFDEDEEIEIVDDLDSTRFSDPATGGEPVPPVDVYERFVGMLHCIAAATDDGAASARLTAALADDVTAKAWRAILLGESDDFAACGSKTLDEWAADLIAQALAAPAKTDLVRRELRSRGVAAFGLVSDTA